MSELEIFKLMINAGTAFAIAVLLIYFIYKLLNKHLGNLIESQQQMAASVAATADAMNRQTDNISSAVNGFTAAVSRQADTMEEMKQSVTAFLDRDHNEHAAMHLDIKMMIGIIKKLDNRLGGDRD